MAGLSSTCDSAREKASGMPGDGRTELVWKGTLEPTGTLYRDDLRELETVLRSGDHDVELTWELEGQRAGVGSARMTAPTIDELIEGRGEFESPEDLSLRARWFPSSGESRRELLEATLETSGDWSEPSVEWRASITADSTLRSQFEVCVDRVREIFARASQASWAQGHPRMHSLVCSSWSTIGVGLTAALWGVLFLILRDGAPALLAALVFGISLETISRPFRRRFESNASWSAPPFDLRRNRSIENLAEPPVVIRRDVVLFLASVMVTIVLAAVGWSLSWPRN